MKKNKPSYVTDGLYELRKEDVHDLSDEMLELFKKNIEYLHPETALAIFEQESRKRVNDLESTEDL